MNGKDVIRAGVRKVVADRNFALSFAPLQVEASKSGEMAYTRGAYTVTSTDPATNRPVTANGKYILIYRKERDGQWRAVHDINNRDAAAPPGRP